jgi:hypothetical protein
MNAGTGCQSVGAHTVDKPLDGGEVGAPNVCDEIYVTNDVPRRQHVRLAREKSLEVIKAQARKANEDQCLKALAAKCTHASTVASGPRSAKAH